ncbi:phage tail tape measure protein [Anoxybacillus flavithermus]|uniref:phage tail tape measure protein n=1 Tax=Anoxybacillus flavithermus TaxID=33934 RepID=UPI001867138D|nr:phage tail tape measure protein [Anoxybacillus flavithermus]MBE2905408.1 phage tail tape measure protein [Anoxybacillus flavithermus]
MAESVRGINVVIGADTTRLGQALSDVESKSKSIQQELRQVERLLKFDPSNTTLLAQKQQLLAQQIENTSEKLNRLKSVQQQVNEQFQRGEISEGQYRAFQREIEKTEGQLRTLQSRLEEINGAINRRTTVWGRLQERLSTVGNNLRDVGQRMQSVGQSMATSMGAAATAIGGALGFAVKKSMDFEAQIDRVGAIAGATPSELKKLEKASLDLGSSTSKSATEVAQGMEIMGAMGYNTNQILAAMPGIIAAAEASGEDMALVADTVSAALNSFGLEASEASRVADVLAQAANDSAAGIQDMQYTFKYAAPVARTLGISLEQLGAATEIMANAGIRGEQAGTTLRAALIRLSDPPKEAAAMLKELGVRITDSNGKMLPFNQIIAQLSKSTEKMSNAQKLAALSTIFGTEAASGMLTVIEAGPQKLDSLTKSLQNSSGASKEAAEKMKNNLKGALEELGGAIETAQISIGDALAPAIRVVAKAIQGLFNAFNNLPEGMKQFIAIGAAISAVLLGVVATIGVVLSIVGTAMQGFGALAGVLASAGGMAGVFSSAIAAITGPIGIAIGAIAGLVAIGVVLYKNWDEIKEFLSATWEGIKTAAQVVWDGIKVYFETVLNIYKTIFVTVWNTIKTAVVAIWDGLKTSATTVFDALKNTISNVWNAVKIVTTTVWNAVASFLTTVWNGIKIAVSTVFDAYKTIITTVWNAIQTATTTIWNSIKNVVISVANGIKQGVSTAISAVENIISTVWSTIKSLTSSVWNSIKSFVMTPVNAIRDAVPSAFETMKSKIADVWEGVKNVIKVPLNSIISLINSFVTIHSDSSM